MCDAGHQPVAFVVKVTMERLLYRGIRPLLSDFGNGWMWLKLAEASSRPPICDNKDGKRRNRRKLKVALLKQSCVMPFSCL